tara:strand:+ start:754 stop:936 length:183 start_codon:yes stop_codon:yes gene_type:complete
MANEIYQKSWWGFKRLIGFGSIYYNYSLNEITTSYTERVSADNGTVEAIDCVNNQTSIFN